MGGLQFWFNWRGGFIHTNTHAHQLFTYDHVILIVICLTLSGRNVEGAPGTTLVGAVALEGSLLEPCVLLWCELVDEGFSRFSLRVRSLQWVCNVFSKDLMEATRTSLPPECNAWLERGWSFPPLTPGAHLRWWLPRRAGGVALRALTKLMSSGNGSSHESSVSGSAWCPNSDRSSIIAEPVSSPNFSRSCFSRCPTRSSSASCSPANTRKYNAGQKTHNFESWDFCELAGWGR